MKEILKDKKILMILLIVLITIIGIVAIILSENTQDDGEIKVDESYIKNVFTTFQKELDDYLAKLDETKYDPSLICADLDNIICGTVKFENVNVYDIIPSLKKSMYKDLVRVANGKLEAKSLSEEEIIIISEVIDLAQYDFSYCISDYINANGLNKSKPIENISVSIEELN